MSATTRQGPGSSECLQAMCDFTAAYRSYTGRELSLHQAWVDVDTLRDAVEHAVDVAMTRDEPTLYRAAEALVLALRAAPLWLPG